MPLNILHFNLSFIQKLQPPEKGHNLHPFFFCLLFDMKYFIYQPSFGECLCYNYTPSFLPLLIFDWRTFSRRVTARWWRQSLKKPVSTNQNSRNRWCLIVRCTICLLLSIMYFQNKTVLLLTYCCLVLILPFYVFVFLKVLFHISAIMK